jgi:hypothetical protein
MRAHYLDFLRAKSIFLLWKGKFKECARVDFSDDGGFPVWRDTGYNEIAAHAAPIWIPSQRSEEFPTMPTEIAQSGEGGVEGSIACGVRRESKIRRQREGQQEWNIRGVGNGSSSSGVF